VAGTAVVGLVLAAATGIFGCSRGGPSGPLGAVIPTWIAPSASQATTGGGGGFFIGVPRGLTQAAPPAGDNIAFLAERKGSGRSIGTSLLVRRGVGAQSDFGDDVGLYDAAEDFAHPRRRVERQTEAHIAGASDAVEIVSDYADSGAGGAEVHKLDVLIRTRAGGSYHLVLLGPPSSVTDAVIAAEVPTLKVQEGAVTTTTVPFQPSPWSPPPGDVSIDVASANDYQSDGVTLQQFLVGLGYQDTDTDFNVSALSTQSTTAIYVGTGGNTTEAAGVAKALGLPASDVMSGSTPSGLNTGISSAKVIVVEGDDLHAQVASGVVSAPTQ